MNELNNTDLFNSGHMVLDPMRNVVFLNRYASTLFFAHSEADSTFSLTDLLSKASSIFVDSYVYPTLKKNRFITECQLQFQINGGDKLPVVTNIQLDDRDYSYWSFYACINRDKLYNELLATKEVLKQQTEQLYELATTDPLTGLLNRREFYSRARQLLNTAIREKQPVAVIALDIDFFKSINDLHGHSSGDQVLIQIAGIFQSNMRINDVLARFGGEEFILMLNGNDQSSAMRIAENIRLAVANATFPTGQVTVSIGVDWCEVNRDTHLDSLLDNADLALYQSKEGGRNRSTLYARTAG